MEKISFWLDLRKYHLNEILDKANKLTPTEYALMKSHTYQILNRIDNFNTQEKWATYHHERINGKGYPFQSKGSDLDVGCRIMSVADIFQALNQNRPYRSSIRRKQVFGHFSFSLIH